MVVSGHLLIMNLRVKASFVAVEGDPVNYDSECLAEQKIPWLVLPVCFVLRLKGTQVGKELRRFHLNCSFHVFAKCFCKI